MSDKFQLDMDKLLGYRTWGEWLSSGTLVYLLRAISKMSGFLLVPWFTCSESYRRWATFFLVRWITCSEPYQRWVVFFEYTGLLVQSRIEGEWLSSGTLVYLFRAVSKVSDFLLVRRFSPPIQLINDINVLLLKLTINFHYTYLCKYCCDQHVILLDTECTDMQDCYYNKTKQISLGS